MYSNSFPIFHAYLLKAPAIFNVSSGKKNSPNSWWSSKFHQIPTSQKLPKIDWHSPRNSLRDYPPGSLTVRPWKYTIPKGEFFFQPSFFRGELLNFGSVTPSKLYGSKHSLPSSKHQSSSIHGRFPGSQQRDPETIDRHRTRVLIGCRPCSSGVVGSTFHFPVSCQSSWKKLGVDFDGWSSPP